MKITFIFSCSGMFRVPGFIDALTYLFQQCIWCIDLPNLTFQHFSYLVLVHIFARISISSRRVAGSLVGFLITSARLSLFELSVLIFKSIYAPVVEFHKGPYKGLFGFLSYGVYVVLKVLVGVIFARALYLKVLGHEPFSRWLFSRLIEFVALSIFSWMEFGSSSCRDLFLSELPLVLADFGGFSPRRFLGSCQGNK